MARKILHISFWIIYFALSAFYKSNNMPLDLAITHTLVGVGISAMIFYGYAQVVKLFLETKKYGWFVIVSVLFFLLFFFIKNTFEVPHFPEFYKMPAFEGGKRISGFIGLVILLTMLFGGLVKMLEIRLENEKRAQAIVLQHQEAQLQFLIAQINPHFLFNTLNNIYSLAVVGSEQTPKMVLKLAELLRYVIYESRKEKVLLEKEVLQIQKYIELFQMKSEHPLNVQFEVDGITNDEMIEPMILIPLVENCFKHCDFETNENAFVRIFLKRKNDQLFFKTQNSKNITDIQKDKIGGVGVENIRQRLALHYPLRHQFKIENKKEVFEVEVVLSTVGN